MNEIQMVEIKRDQFVAASSKEAARWMNPPWYDHFKEQWGMTGLVALGIFLCAYAFIPRALELWEMAE